MAMMVMTLTIPRLPRTTPLQGAASSVSPGNDSNCISKSKKVFKTQNQRRHQLMKEISLTILLAEYREEIGR